MEENSTHRQIIFKEFCEALRIMEKAFLGVKTLNNDELFKLLRQYEQLFFLAVKVMNAYVTEEGYSDKLSIKPVIEQMSRYGLIELKVWKEMNKMRDKYFKVTDRTLLKEFLNKINDQYLPVMIEFETKVNEPK